MAKNGDHYWVLAHVTPSYDGSGAIDGYHSNRRVPDRKALAAIEPLYRDLLATEKAAADRKAGLAARQAQLDALLPPRRPEERRVGQECVRTCRSRGSADPYKKKKKYKH